jgi:hypothetical protein
MRNLTLIYVNISIPLNYFRYCSWFCIFEQQFFENWISFIHQNTIKFSNQSGTLQRARLDPWTSDWTKWSENFRFLTHKPGRHWPDTHSAVDNDIQYVRQEDCPPRYTVCPTGRLPSEYLPKKWRIFIKNWINMLFLGRGLFLLAH